MTAAAADLVSSQSNLHVELASADVFDVREFSVREGLSALFSIEIVAVCDNPDVDFSKIVGQRAAFRVERARSAARRKWTGVCSHIELIRAEEGGLSTYAIRLVPTLWLLTQRRNYRIFQQQSEPSIALELLAEWNIEPELRLALEGYKERKYRVQYGESDYAFLCRMLEDAGITFLFEDGDEETKLVLSDAPEKNDVRPLPLPYVATPNPRIEQELVTNLRVRQQVRPGKYTVRDHDYRRPADFPLLASASGGEPVEDRLERFHYVPGAFLYRAANGDGTPVADDRGRTRTDPEQGRRLAADRLAAQRVDAKGCVFQTTATDLRPGQVIAIAHHPRHELGPGKTLLLVTSSLSGSAVGAWSHDVESRFTDVPFKPPLLTPKPRTQGVESATVVGPAGEEVHTDEFGRVRVHFHWDRNSERNERSSCWIHVSQSWGGGSFGAVNLPRVGQEVLVDFLSGDPDRPVIVGRVFTNLQRTPYELPRYKSVSGIRSQSLQPATAGAPPAAPSPSPRGGGTPMSLERLNQTLSSRDFKARSPGGQTHQWSGSELTFDDTNGSETVYLQAQRDFNSVVKNCSTAIVANARSAIVGTDDVLNVENKQEVRVGVDRTVLVGRDQHHIVEGNIIQESKEGFQFFKSKLDFTSVAERHVLQSDKTIVLRVGTSSIVLGPNYIVIQAENTFINPGEGIALEAQEGTRPLTQQELERMRVEQEARAAAERAAAEREARIQRGVDAIDGIRRTLPPGISVLPSDALGRPNENAFLRQRLADDVGVRDRAEQDEVMRRYWSRPDPMGIDNR